MCETVRSTSSMRSRFQLLRMLRKCSSCTLFMYASPRLAMYGVTLRGPASRLPASSDSSPSPSPCTGRGVAVIPPADGIPFAVTTMRSDGGDLRMAWATGVAPAAWLAAGAGLTGATGLTGAAALVVAADLVGEDFAADFAATGFVAGFFAVNFGFSAFFGLAGFAAARLVGIVCRSRPRFGWGPVCRTRDYSGGFTPVQSRVLDDTAANFLREIRAVGRLWEPASPACAVPRPPSCKSRPGH